ncbi:MAG: glycosyltransferase, partial [Candidatus Sericytochromatia bacterium]|nr:glycosyltransferase [Candidatus Tanganyikabacteria bacterium]
MILFAAGGTGGHLYPALAIAEALRRRDPAVEIAFTGTPDHLEAQVVPGEGYPFFPIPVMGLPRRPGPGILQFFWLLVKGVMQARALISRLGPEVVVGCGAYVSAPAVIAARLARIPVLLAESNAYPGIANRLLGRLADRVAVAIPGTEASFRAGRAICLGNPIRAAFGQIDRSAA